MRFDLLVLQVSTLCTAIGCFIRFIAHDTKTLALVARQKQGDPPVTVHVLHRQQGCYTEIENIETNWLPHGDRKHRNKLVATQR
jgi:hypothetical protein